MKKRSLIYKTMIALMLILCLCIPVMIFADDTTTDGNNDAAAEDMTITLTLNNPVMTVNGQTQNIDDDGTVPVLLNNRTLLPVRAVVEAMEGTVEWDNATKTAILTHGENEIRLTINSTTAYLNDAAQTLDTVPTIINNRTMLPIRFVSESFGYHVGWTGSESLVTITNNPELLPAVSEGKVLIAYFSKTGNTKGVAEEIQKNVDGDLIEIVPVTPYPEDYNENVEQARTELAENARPAISTTVANMDEYDVVYIGYPIWHSTIPMPVATFLEGYDFTGKTVIPFSTHGGSGLGSSIEDITTIIEGAEILEALSIRGSASSTVPTEVAAWLRTLQMID